jgi:3-hydroxyisobutyrate dehydrogenase
MDRASGVIGVIGVGNMGGAMAARLLELGWTVQVHDLDAPKTQALQSVGARVCDSPAQAARGAHALIVCVVDAAQTREVLFGDRGAVRGLPQGAAVLLCPTISPEDVEDCAARLQALGFGTVDAPMSGGPARARDGSMSLMVACPDAVFAQCRPLIEALSSRVFRIGARPGDGARTKLVNNLLAAINLAGAAEALAMAQRMGLDARATLAAIEQSSGQSWIGTDRMRRALEGDYAPRAHVSLLQKDSRLAVEAGRAAGFEGPLGPVARDLFQRAAEAGLAELDDAALFKFLASRS